MFSIYREILYTPKLPDNPHDVVLSFCPKYKGKQLNRPLWGFSK